MINKTALKEVAGELGLPNHKVYLILREVAEGRFLIGQQYCLKQISDKVGVPIDKVNRLFYTLLLTGEVAPIFTCVCKVCKSINSLASRSADMAFNERCLICVKCGTHLDFIEAIDILIEFYKKGVDRVAICVEKNELIETYFNDVNLRKEQARRVKL